MALGIEGGVMGWNGAVASDMGRYDAAMQSYYVGSSADNRSTLQHLSTGLRLLGSGRDPSSGPYAVLSAGAYRQVIADRVAGAIRADPRFGKLRPGATLGMGASGRRGLKPGIEMRVLMIATEPRRSLYFTIGIGLYGNW